MGEYSVGMETTAIEIDRPTLMDLNRHRRPGMSTHNAATLNALAPAKVKRLFRDGRVEHLRIKDCFAFLTITD